MGPEDQHPWDREDEEIRKAFAAKDAEIERLKEENFRYSETQTKLDWAKETNGKLYAEIEELNGSIKRITDELARVTIERVMRPSPIQAALEKDWSGKEAEIKLLKSLASEAADSIEDGEFMPQEKFSDILQRLREASK